MISLPPLPLRPHGGHRRRRASAPAGGRPGSGRAKRRVTTSRAGEERLDELVYTRVLVRRGEDWRLAANHVAEPSAQPDARARGGGGDLGRE